MEIEILQLPFHLCTYIMAGRVKTRPTHRRTDANLYPTERQLTKVSEPSFDLEGKKSKSNLTKGQI